MVDNLKPRDAARVLLYDYIDVNQIAHEVLENWQTKLADHNCQLEEQEAPELERHVTKIVDSFKKSVVNNK